MRHGRYRAPPLPGPRRVACIGSGEQAAARVIHPGRFAVTCASMTGMQRAVRVAIASAVLLAACSSGDDGAAPEEPAAGAASDITIETDDGAVSLTIAAGSLPDGIGPSDISIELIAPDELAQLTEVSPALAALADLPLAAGPAYRLRPDGLELGEPASLRVPLPGDSELLTTFLVDDAGTEILPLEATDPDSEAETEAEILEVRVPHFSIVTTYIFFRRMRVTAPDMVVAGEPFTATLDLERTAEGSDPYLFSGRVTTVNLDPPLTPLGTGTLIEADLSLDLGFTCSEAGPAALRTYGSVTIDSPFPSTWDQIVNFFTPNVPTITFGPSEILSLLVCTAPTDEQLLGGAWSGNLEVLAIPNAPGAGYFADFVLELDGCGGARLVQDGTQATHGTATVTFRTSDGRPSTLRVELAGEGPDYREGYLLVLRVDADGTIVVDGTLAGGGHGAGDLPTPERISAALEVAWDSLEGVPPGYADDLGWLSAIQGRLERTGDASPCD